MTDPRWFRSYWDEDVAREQRAFFHGLDAENRELDEEQAYNERMEGKQESTLDRRDLR